MENQHLIIETVYVQTPMSNPKIDNLGIKDIPENVRALELTISCNNKFKNLELIYLHKFYNDFNSIYENNIIERIKANLVNPEKVKILDQIDFEEKFLTYIFSRI